MPEQVKIIEWQHLDKKKFYIIGPTTFCCIRGLLYPPNLIKTRLQVQKKRSLYKGTFDAFQNILKLEGIRGLYKGYLVSNLSVLSGQFYITTYELVRQRTARYNLAFRGFLAGAGAAVVGQAITVPLDIITQKLMVQGQGQSNRNLKGAWTIIREIKLHHGMLGFYNGFFISLMTYGPTSGVWWASYGTYLGIVGNIVPDGTSVIIVQGISGPLAGLTAATATNPLDVLRTRLQVEARNSVVLVLKELLQEEGIFGLTKGLSARIANMMPSSLLITLGYETIKRLSLRNDLIESGEFKRR